jgi:hypothetical protein
VVADPDEKAAHRQIVVSVGQLNQSRRF